jgi:multidrug transporter EmrE-like cation transporter
LPYLLIFITLIGNVIGLLLVKKTVIDAGQAPRETGDIITFLIKVLVNPITWLAFLAVFIGLLAFWLALTKMELSRIYPIIGGLSYILVAIFSVLLFKENITMWGWLGVVLVSAGVILLFNN